MNVIMIVVTAIFLAITALLGWIGYRQTKNPKDFLLGGGKVHPVIMAISYGSTFISTSAIVGFGGAASVYGMGILWLTVLNIFVGIFIAFIIFGKRTRRMGHALEAHTFPEFLGKRYQSKFLQVAGAGVIFLGMPLYAGAVMLGGVSFLTIDLGMSREWAILLIVVIVGAYVLFGGMKGVMYTDAFQGALMIIGMLILLIFTYNSLGGVTQAHESLSALASKVPEKMLAAGHQGWTAMPKDGSPMWWDLIGTIVLSVGIGVLAQPQLSVRFMTVKSDRELNRGVMIGAIFIMLMTGIAFTVGALSNVYFFKEFGTMAIGAPDIAGKADAVIPFFIKSNFPAWFRAVFLITLLSAAMSTMSSQFHSMGSAIGHDILDKGFGIKAKKPITVVRIAMLISIAIATLVAWFLPGLFKDGTTVIASGTALFFGLCAGAFLSVYILGMFWKGTTKIGAIAGFCAGLGISILVLLFAYEKVSASLGLCKLIFGKSSIFSGTIYKALDPLIFAVPISLLTTWIVSLLTKKFTTQHLALCFPAKK